jgi:hypothetical protein
MKISITQKIAKFFTSKSMFEKMMNESKQYQFDCACGKTSNIWEIGGIRYKAYGKPTTLVKCPHCRKIAMRKIYKAEK